MVRFNNALGIDYGGARVGIARINSVAQIAQPLTTLSNNENLVAAINDIVEKQEVDLLVVGYPRNLSGQPTAQTAEVLQFVEVLRKSLSINIVLHDETLSTVHAEQQKIDPKIGLDAYAAADFLEDYVRYNKTQQ